MVSHSIFILLSHKHLPLNNIECIHGDFSKKNSPKIVITILSWILPDYGFTGSETLMAKQQLLFI
jgi:hypothetical protein